MKKLKDINWNQVYYFYEVARKMSMKEAAEVTGVSIPTVSEQIKRLETLLETPLFHRRPRRIELTVEGEILFQHAKSMFEAGLRFLDVVSPTVIGGYPVRIGIQETFAVTPAFDFLYKYFDTYSPFGTVHTFREPVAERLIERVFNGELDWAVTLNPPPVPRLEYGRIGSTEIAFCSSSEVLETHKNRAELFEYLPLARSRWDEQLNKLVADHLQAADIYVEEIIESEHWDMCMHLAEQGKCVTAVAKTAVPATGGSNLRSFTVGGPIVVNFHAIWRPTNQRMIAIRKLIELIEKDTKGVRPRVPTPTLPGGNASGEAPPIELPHHFESESLDLEYPKS